MTFLISIADSAIRFLFAESSYFDVESYLHMVVHRHMPGHQNPIQTRSSSCTETIIKNGVTNPTQGHAKAKKSSQSFKLPLFVDTFHP